MFASCLGDHSANSALTDGGGRFFHPVAASADKLCLKLVNAASSERPLSVAMQGLGAGVYTACATTLRANTSTSWVTNTIQQPNRIAPADSTLKMNGATAGCK